MEHRAESFRACAAQSVSAQKVETSAIRRAYLESMQGWRESDDEIERLDRKRPKHLPELWKNLPPKDPHDDDDDYEDDDEDDRDNDHEEPAVIREPDEC